MNPSEFLARLRNLVSNVKLVGRKDGDAVEVETIYGRGYELAELKPYGLASKPESGKGLCLFVGGDTRSPVLLPLDNREGQPELEDGEVALYHSAGHCVVLRQDGTLEVGGTDNGGLIKWQELQTQLDKVNTFLQTLQQVLGALPPVSEPGNGSSSVLQTTLSAALASLELPDYGEVESDKVLHGEGGGA
ncbi:hypothetical protein P0082_07730 [Candidatus Haliotispira prima]|uniref:Phage baseplate assembly protein V n=1 Tax=Candidatus Haliotispira prima TaxID=3034016 RepID=A0ABY8MGB1_9SPIO|nr:hypothetical protein P0082_07730 [Candidatus Haliotispira prima]